MIGVRLMGGLGNQMFQYAIARELANLHHTDVVMDQIFFENIAEVDTPRYYELDCFKLQANFLDLNKRPVENPEVAYQGKRGRLRQLQHQLAGNSWHIYREPHHNFDPNALKQPNKTYLIGYWQTEKYFADIRPTILADFSFRDEPTRKNQQLLKAIAQSPSVSIHVRRGDYISNPNANKFHGTKDTAYYQTALQAVLKKVKNPHLFVFSDDPEWCKQNLRFKQPTTYVEGNKKGYEDMRLMMHCDHNIIANSSFSWWAAWLNTNPEKIVVAPKQWFNDPTVNVGDVLPKSWLKV